MHHAFICDAVRTPFGRPGGALALVRADDPGALPISANLALDLIKRAGICHVPQGRQVFSPIAMLLSGPGPALPNPAQVPSACLGR